MKKNKIVIIKIRFSVKRFAKMKSLANGWRTTPRSYLQKSVNKMLDGMKKV